MSTAARSRRQASESEEEEDGGRRRARSRLSRGQATTADAESAPPSATTTSSSSAAGRSTGAGATSGPVTVMDVGGPGAAGIAFTAVPNCVEELLLFYILYREKENDKVSFTCKNEKCHFYLFRSYFNIYLYIYLGIFL